MLDWETVLAWALQGLGAAGAIWGLFSSETSKKDKRTGKRRLTERGWLAALSVVLGVCGFALNQSAAAERAKDDRLRISNESERAEQIKTAALASQQLLESQKAQLEMQAKLERIRADLTSQQLLAVTAAQGDLGQSQANLFASQRSQISYLSNLAVAQQTISRLELSWPSDEAVQRSVSQTIERLNRSVQLDRSGDDVYLGLCLEHGDVRITRRPNAAWRLNCVVMRPQGARPVNVEIAAGDRRMQFLDTFFDVVLSPDLTIENSKGDIIAVSNAVNRPESLNRLQGTYTVTLAPPRTRFSSFIDRALRIRMDVRQIGSLPRLMRIRSMDPMARFDTRWQPAWRMQAVDQVWVQMDPGADPEPRDVMNAVAPISGFAVSFDKMLRPTSH